MNVRREFAEQATQRRNVFGLGKRANLGMGDQVAANFEVGGSQTSTSAETARRIFVVEGGSSARVSTSSIVEPRLTFIVLMRNARSERLSLVISGSG